MAKKAELPNSRYTLKTVRELRNMTQQEAAEGLGVSIDTLRRYERGKSFPDVPMLRKMEEVYGVRYDQLIFLPLDYC